MAAEVDPRVVAVASAGAIGISGYLLPDSVHIVDIHGLADPIASRLIIEKRSRPGHDKRLPVEWTLARFAETLPTEDAAITAARRALGCAPLRDLVQAVTGPLSFRAFVDNVARAYAFTKLRLPQDPFEAQERFCADPPPFRRTIAVAGGTAFRWECPTGIAVSGIRGDFVERDEGPGRDKGKEKDRVLASVRAECGEADGANGEGEGEGAKLVGPVFGGKTTDTAFEVSCPSGSSATGIFGRRDTIVRALGLFCSSPDAVLTTNSAGQAGGAPFDLRCPAGTRVAGIEGRAGDLVDAVGIVCLPGG